MKTCSRCSAVKPLDAFTKTRSHCRECEALKYKKWAKSNREKIRLTKIKGNFGLSAEEYRAMLEKQGYVCAICHQTCKVYSHLSVDHDHATGKVRGLLCKPCNIGLGEFKDNVNHLQSALVYLLAT